MWTSVLRQSSFTLDTSCFSSVHKSSGFAPQTMTLRAPTCMRTQRTTCPASNRQVCSAANCRSYRPYHLTAQTHDKQHANTTSSCSTHTPPPSELGSPFPHCLQHEASSDVHMRHVSTFASLASGFFGGQHKHLLQQYAHTAFTHA